MAPKAAPAPKPEKPKPKKKRGKRQARARNPKSKVGPPTKYNPDLHPRLLIEHFKKGHGIHLFGATLEPYVGESTIYEWVKAYPEMAEAKRVAEPLAEIFWTNLLTAGASGQLRRLKSKEPMLDGKGNLVLDQAGKPMFKESFEQASFNATATIFALKNKFPARYRDRRELDLGNAPDRGPLKVSEMEPEKAAGLLKKLGAVLAEAARPEEKEDEE